MKKTMLVILAIVLCFSSMSACAKKDAEYPSQAIELVIPASPGGGSDIMGRLLVDVVQNKKLSSQTVTAVNKAGGGGSAGQAYINSKKDPNHTIFTINDAHTIAATVSNTRPEGNFTSIAMLAADQVMFVTGGNSPYTTMDQAVEAIKAKPLDLAVGVADQLDKICVYDINNSYGVKFKDVYFDSAAEIATALMGGHIDFGMFNPSECAALVEAGELKALGIFASERNPEPFEDVPTFTEMGHKDLLFAMSRGVLGPAGMSKEAQLYWSGIFKVVCDSDEWKAYLESGGLTPSYMDCDSYATYYENNEKALIEKAKALGDIK